MVICAAPHALLPYGGPVSVAELSHSQRCLSSATDIGPLEDSNRHRATVRQQIRGAAQMAVPSPM